MLAIYHASHQITPYALLKEELLINNKGIYVFSVQYQMMSYYNRIWFQRTDDFIYIIWNTKHEYIDGSAFEYRAKLYKDGTIELNYNNLDDKGLDWIAGISSGSSANYIIADVSNNSSIPDSTLIRFTPPNEYFEVFTLTEDGLLSGTTPETPAHEGTFIRDFKVKVTDYTGAYVIRDYGLSTWPVSVFENKNDDNNITIYPNPGKDIISIQTKNNETISNIIILNNMGQKIYATNMNSNHAQINMDKIGLKDGVYFVKLMANNKIHLCKLIKK